MPQLHLPRPLRAAVPFLAPAGVALVLCVTPVWPLGLVAVGAFGVAGGIAAWREQRDLDRLRSSADVVLLRRTRAQISPLLVWRSAEVTAPAFRDHVAGDLRRLVRMARTSVLPGAAPVDRGAVRRNADDLLALAGRLEGPDPLDAHAVLLARGLVHDARSPLYATEGGDAADRAIAEAVRAFDDASRASARR